MVLDEERCQMMKDVQIILSGKSAGEVVSFMSVMAAATCYILEIPIQELLDEVKKEATEVIDYAEEGHGIQH